MTFDPLELFDFISDAKDEVRIIATENIAGMSLDQGFQTSLNSRLDLVSALFQRIFDANIKVADFTWKALVNLSQDPVISSHLADKFSLQVASFICTAAQIDSGEEDATFVNKNMFIFGDLACMLLSNMSKNICCRESLAPFLAAFYQIAFLKCQKCTFDFIFSVIADMTGLQVCRRYLVEGEDAKFLKFVSFLADKSIIRRGGVAAIIKNCLLEVDYHPSMLGDFDDRLLSGLLGRICSPECQFSEEELDEMLVELNLEHRLTPIESDSAIRQMIIESLIALGTTFEGRCILREKKCYPIAREAHKQETLEELRALYEIFVEYLIRDEDHENIRPEKALKCSQDDEDGDCVVPEEVAEDLDSLLN